jgi:hypothetical protein
MILLRYHIISEYHQWFIIHYYDLIRIILKLCELKLHIQLSAVNIYQMPHKQKNRFWLNRILSSHGAGSRHRHSLSSSNDYYSMPLRTAACWVCDTARTSTANCLSSYIFITERNNILILLSDSWTFSIAVSFLFRN